MGEVLQYLLDVYDDDFIGMAISALAGQLMHVSTALLNDIHDIFLEAVDDENDLASIKKIKKQYEMWTTQKEILGYYFGSNPRNKTGILAGDKRSLHLLILYK